MSADHLSFVASILADRTRARFAMALMDGRDWTLGDLATEAGVAASTASEHLNRMLGAGLITERRHGRHRHVRLASPRVAACLEDLTGLPDPQIVPPDPAGASGGLRAVSKKEALTRGRTCYDHLAGRFGVLITDALVHRGVLDPAVELTSDGPAWFTETLGSPMTGGRRPRSRSCLDWTERRPHLAGAAGAALCRTFFDRGWITRVGSGRAVRPSTAGCRAIGELFGIDPGEVWPYRLR